jgi:hypothetical protein
LSYATLPIVWMVGSLSASSSVVCVVVHHLHCIVVVCVNVCVVICIVACGVAVCGIVSCVVFVCVVVCGVVVCIVISYIIVVCVAGVGGRVYFILCNCGGGGRWCDIPVTWQMMVRTYSNKQCSPSKYYSIEKGRMQGRN